jgi:hypothetical protein
MSIYGDPPTTRRCSTSTPCSSGSTSTSSSPTPRDFRFNEAARTATVGHHQLVDHRDGSRLHRQRRRARTITGTGIPGLYHHLERL